MPSVDLPEFAEPILFLHTEDFERTELFWTEVLGFEVTERDDDGGVPKWLALRRGAPGPIFVRPVELEDPKLRDPSLSGQLYYKLPPAPPGDRGTLLDAEAERIAAHGVSFEWGPETMPYGLREFAVRDPNGYRVIVGQAVAAVA